jgi:hypothetical protein
VNLLSSILPGVRDLRTPTAVGALWATVIYLVAGSDWFSVAKGAYVGRLVAALQDLPDVYVAGAAGVGLYLLGAACVPIQNYVLTKALHLGKRQFRTTATGEAWSRRRLLRPVSRLRWRLQGTFREDAESAPGLLYSTMASKLTAVGAPTLIASLLPADVFINQLERLASQLQINAPGQAQEFDRLNSESEFRRGVSVPLAALLGLLAWDVVPWLVPLAFVLPVVLLGQSFRRQRAATDVLANSVYLNQLKLPSLERWAEVLKASHPPDGALVGEWVAATCLAWRSTEDDWLSNAMAVNFYRQYADSLDDIAAFRAYVEAHPPVAHDLFAASR